MSVINLCDCRMAMLQDACTSVSGLREAQKRELRELISKRWDFLHSDMHSAGYALDPEYLNDQELSTEV